MVMCAHLCPRQTSQPEVSVQDGKLEISVPDLDKMSIDLNHVGTTWKKQRTTFKRVPCVHVKYVREDKKKKTITLVCKDERQVTRVCDACMH